MVLNVEGYDDICDDLALFMDMDDVNYPPISDTSFFLLTIDAAKILDTPVSTDDFIVAQRHDPPYQNFAKYVGLTSSQFA